MDCARNLRQTAAPVNVLLEIRVHPTADDLSAADSQARAIATSLGDARACAEILAAHVGGTGINPKWLAEYADGLREATARLAEALAASELMHPWQRSGSAAAGGDPRTKTQGFA